jgi:N-acylneuraminate cytidylyltransferase
VILCVIPARGGSKRVPRKNVRPFLGRPMIAWAIGAAQAAGVFDRILVSTDDDEIAAVARAEGAETPFRRPAELSDDHTGTREVIAHAAAEAERLWGPAEAVCCLYATAALTDPADLRAGLDRLRAGGARTVFPVAPFPSPIQRALRQDADGRLSMIDPAAYAMRSQDLEPAFHDAGQFYWAAPGTWAEPLPVFAPGAVGLPVDPWRALDIDTPQDWRMAELVAGALRDAAPAAP